MNEYLIGRIIIYIFIYIKGINVVNKYPFKDAESEA